MVGVPRLADMVQQTTTKEGDGLVVFLDGVSPEGRVSFATGFTDGDLVYFTMSDEDTGGGNRETCEAVLTVDTPSYLTIQRVVSNTNGGVLIDWPAGSKAIFAAPPAEYFEQRLKARLHAHLYSF